MRCNVMTTNEIRKNKINRRRKRIRKQRIECVLNAITVVGFFYLIGAVGGYEQELMTGMEFAMHMVGAVGIMAGSIAINTRV